MYFFMTIDFATQFCNINVCILLRIHTIQYNLLVIQIFLTFYAFIISTFCNVLHIKAAVMSEFSPLLEQNRLILSYAVIFV